MVDVNKVVGTPILLKEKHLVVPICKLTFGFMAGGSDFDNQKIEKNNFGGGSGAGINITPIAFLVIENDEVKLLHTEKETHIFEKIIDLIPKNKKTTEKITETY